MKTGKELAIAVAEKLGDEDTAYYYKNATTDYMLSQAAIYIKHVAARLLPEYAERVDEQLIENFFKEDELDNIDLLIRHWWRTYTHTKFLEVWLQVMEGE